VLERGFAELFVEDLALGVESEEAEEAASSEIFAIASSSPSSK
jgi:hypothetical protein